ncbi:MAG: DUF5060 domain-containing protein [Planctomycetes bacterium]|nr:DUF5060 domain-containing protein [Planctomycetota bacterium]
MRHILTALIGIVFLCGAAHGAQDRALPESQVDKQRAVAAEIAATGGATRGATRAQTGPMLAAAAFTSSGIPTSSVSISGVTANSASVPRFGRFELTVALTVNDGVAVDRPFETDPARGGLDLYADFSSPTGVVKRAYGFYDAATAPATWKIRFAPDEMHATNPWTYAIGTVPASAPLTGSFLCDSVGTAASSKGWLRIDRTALRFSGDGTTFWGLGHNTGWRPDVEVPTAAVMRSNGLNVLSFWMSEPWVRQYPDASGKQVLPARAPLENVGGGLGNYNQSACAYIDGVVSRAEAAGLYLIPSLWAHDEVRDASSPWGAASWDNSAYQSVCAGAGQFYVTSNPDGSDTEAWHYQKNRYRYIVARWGMSTAIAAWVGMVEIDGTSGIEADKRAWSAKVRAHLASIDPYRIAASGAYPFVVTKTDDASSDATSFPSFLDLMGCDTYSSKRRNYDTVVSGTTYPGIATTIANQTDAMRGVGKPCLHTEFGGEIASGSAASQPTHLHNGIWAALASGSAVSPMLWTDGGSYPMLDPATTTGTAMLTHYRHLSAFAGALSYAGSPDLVKALPTYNHGSIKGWGMRLGGSNDRGFVWTQAAQNLNHTSYRKPVPTVTVGYLASGTYAVTWVNTWTGATIQTSSVTATVVTVGGTATTGIVVKIPAIAYRDAAVRFALSTGSAAAKTSQLAVGDDGVSMASSATTGAAVHKGKGHGCGLGSGLALLIAGLGLALRGFITRPAF